MRFIILKMEKELKENTLISMVKLKNEYVKDKTIYDLGKVYGCNPKTIEVRLKKYYQIKKLKLLKFI